jgi:sugar diacid utilization regulator
VTRETLKQAAKRHKVKANTLYRRLERLAQAGKVKVNQADFVGPTLYLDVQTWDSVCSQTLPPGRPRKID